MEEKKTLRVTAYQGAPKATFNARKEQIKQVLQRADAEKIDFICFPEGFLTGYYAQEKSDETTEERKTRNSL